MDFIVTEKAMRPASDKRQCFYCQQAIGEPHKPECVLIHKMVKVRMTIEYGIEVPADWDKDQIEFHRNDGSWCSDNALDELKEVSELGGCLCHVSEFEYLGGDGEPYLDEK